jgi:hypothetical protein
MSEFPLYKGLDQKATGIKLSNQHRRISKAISRGYKAEDAAKKSGNLSGAHVRREIQMAKESVRSERAVTRLKQMQDKRVTQAQAMVRDKLSKLPAAVAAKREMVRGLQEDVRASIKGLPAKVAAKREMVNIMKRGEDAAKAAKASELANPMNKNSSIVHGSKMSTFEKFARQGEDPAHPGGIGKPADYNPNSAFQKFARRGESKDRANSSGYTNPGLEKALATKVDKDTQEALARGRAKLGPAGGGKGKGRGNWGHKGRKGIRGGSA